jgi:hypothetical protein
MDQASYRLAVRLTPPSPHEDLGKCDMEMKQHVLIPNKQRTIPSLSGRRFSGQTKERH